MFSGNLEYIWRQHERWLGWQDSNLRMPGSKPGALPLGDTPFILLTASTALFSVRLYLWVTAAGALALLQHALYP